MFTNHIPDGPVQTLLQRTLIMYCSLFTFNKLQSWKKVFCIKTYKLIWCLRSLSIRLTTMPEIKHNTWHVTLFHNLFSKNIAKKQGVCRFSHIASHCFHRDKKGKWQPGAPNKINLINQQVERFWQFAGLSNSGVWEHDDKTERHP